MIRFFFILLSWAFLLNSQAQSVFKPGFVIQLNGDTLYGNIDYRGDRKMHSTCRFKDQNNQIFLFTPNDISAYRFQSGKFFISKSIEDKKVFLEFLLNGIVDLYYKRDKDGDHYYLEKDGQSLVEIPFQEGIKAQDGKQYYYTTNKHIGYLTYYMQDAPELFSEINKMKKLEYVPIIKLTEKYHNKVCDTISCIVYQKPLPSFKVAIEGILGVTSIYLLKNAAPQSQSQYGVLGHFWLPRVNEKMYLRLGYIQTNVHYQNENIMLQKIPVQIEYIFPESKVKPRIAAGYTFYRPFFLTLSGHIGLESNLSSNFGLSLGYDLEMETFEKFIVVPNNLFAQSLQLGAFYKF